MAVPGLSQFMAGAASKYNVSPSVVTKLAALRQTGAPKPPSWAAKGGGASKSGYNSTGGVSPYVPQDYTTPSTTNDATISAQYKQYGFSSPGAAKSWISQVRASGAVGGGKASPSPAAPKASGGRTSAQKAAPVVTAQPGTTTQPQTTKDVLTSLLLASNGKALSSSQLINAFQAATPSPTVGGVSVPQPSTTPTAGSASAVPVSGAVTGGALPNVARWNSLVQQASSKYGVPASLLLADIQQESGGNPGETSSAGAFGLTQFIPSTAKSYGVMPGSTPAALKSQIFGQAALLSSGVKQYGSLTGALEDYYGGPGGVANPNEVVKGGPTPAQYAASVEALQAHYRQYDPNVNVYVNPKNGNVIPYHVQGADAQVPQGASVPHAAWNPSSKPIANWIVPVLEWASAHGWTGHVTSGQRTDAEQEAAAKTYVAGKGVSLAQNYPNGVLASNHVRSAYPGGAVDVSDGADLDRILAAYPGPKKLVWGSVIGDPVHFSATGH